MGFQERIAKLRETKVLIKLSQWHFPNSPFVGQSGKIFIPAASKLKLVVG